MTRLSNLVTAVSGIQLANSAINIASGLGALAEQFRTSKDFKKRVNLAAVIVEGKYDEVYNVQTGKTIIIKKCQYNTLTNLLKQNTDTEAKRLKVEQDIDNLGCGVIDLLKFNLVELDTINNAASQIIHDNFADANHVVIDYYKAINANDTRVMSELENILRFKEMVSTIKESRYSGVANDTTLEMKIRLRGNIESIFAADPTLKNSIIDKIKTCPTASCGTTLALLNFSVADEGCYLPCRNSDTVCLTKRNNCRNRRNKLINDTTPDQFDSANGLIIGELEKRESDLLARNKVNIADLQRITPNYNTVITELKSIKDKRNQLNEVLDSSQKALDAWAESHANLRVAVNAKQPLSVAKLAAKVREIWAILNPEKTE